MGWWCLGDGGGVTGDGVSKGNERYQAKRGDAEVAEVGRGGADSRGWTADRACGLEPKARSALTSGLPLEDEGNGGTQGGFQNGGFGVGDRDGDLANGLVGGGLAGDRHQVGGAFWVFADDEFTGTAGLFRLVEEFRLWHPALEHGKGCTQIGESPLHGDFVFPVELLFAGLVGTIDEDAGLFAIEAEADHAALAAAVGFVDWIFKIEPICGAGFRGGIVVGLGGLAVDGVVHGLLGFARCI